MSSSEQDQVLNTEESVQTKVEAPVKQTSPTTSQPKKTASYTYWVDDKNKSRQLPPEQRPQKIDPPKVATQKVVEGRSHWNTAGTWEHRQISLSDVEKQYSERINEWLRETCPEAKISSISLKGECEVVFIRNKKALTYQISGKVEFQKTLPSQNKQQQQQPTTQQAPQPQTSQKSPQQKDNKQSDSLSLSDDNKSDNSSQSPKPASKKTSKKAAKPATLTFEIVELSDQGDREHKSKADAPDDKKWIAANSNKLMTLLEDIVKAYK